jgi:16S rRNA (guanine1516-N2)-methyltransferase
VPEPLAVAAGEDGTTAIAMALAERLALPLYREGAPPPLLLRVELSGISLQQTDTRTGPVSVDFAGSAMRHRRRGGHNEPLGRAVGLTGRPGLQVLDATAGLGRDAFVLADLGARVTLCERHRVLAVMLEDALQRARESDDPWLQACADRMTLVPGSAQALWLDHPVDVIYLDPMFPGGRSAAAGKELAVLQRLLPDADDAAELAHSALQSGCARVVVKRPQRAAPLAPRVSHVIAGRSIRFDVYVLRPLPERQAAASA